MAKDITAKDVLYALEYRRDALMRVPTSGKARWMMKATGAPVKEAVANEVRASGQLADAAQRARDGRVRQERAR